MEYVNRKNVKEIRITDWGFMETIISKDEAGRASKAARNLCCSPAAAKSYNYRRKNAERNRVNRKNLTLQHLHLIEGMPCFQQGFCIRMPILAGHIKGTFILLRYREEGLLRCTYY